MTTRTASRSVWIGFTHWAGAGVLVSLSLAAAASFGLFLLPVAGAAIVLLARRGGAWPVPLGVVAGVGVTLLALAALNLDSAPCTGTTLTVAPGETSVSCGGFDPRPFAVAGALLVAGATIAFVALLRRR